MHKPTEARPSMEVFMIKSILKRSSLFIFTVLCLSSLILPFSLSAAGESNTLEASIAADVASGRDIAQIIQSAIAGGMSLEDAIGAIIKAGGDPANVTYLAITAKYPAGSVVKGACEGIAKMKLSREDLLKGITLIFSAAIQAGASQTQICKSCLAAGVDSTLIANAYSEASTTQGPAFGYTPPGGPTGLGFGAPGPGSGGSGGGGGGGGGGAAIKIRTASRYKPLP